MNKKLIIGFSILFLLGGVGFYAYQNRSRPPVESKFVQNVGREEEEKTISQITQPMEMEEIELTQPRNYALLDNRKHVYQTFNNCGPATLSMILSWFGVDVSQSELGSKMRPYQNPKGDNDDKTIFTSEFVEWAKKFDLQALSRVNGDIELLKKFTTNGIPVVVKTWLNPGEDIGHFRLVRGFDEEKKLIIQDDSYHGPNKKIPYFDFLSMWQPFNYNYMIVYTEEMSDKVETIIRDELDEKIAFSKALERAQREKELDKENLYPVFNISTSAYHLQDYEASVKAFESVETQLPRRMLWYQIEPILAYRELRNYQRVFEISDRLFNNGNRAFSELYLLRGEIYLEQGKKDEAKQQFELALTYNQNFEQAKEALTAL